MERCFNCDPLEPEQPPWEWGLSPPVEQQLIASRALGWPQPELKHEGWMPWLLTDGSPVAPTTSRFEVVYARTYEWLAVGRGHRPVYYQEFGGRRGNWFLISTSTEGGRRYYMDWGEYGGCSRCDMFLRMVGDSGRRPGAIGEIHPRPRGMIDRADIVRTAMDDRYDSSRFWYQLRGRFDMRVAQQETAAAVCLLEGFQPAARHVLGTRNVTIRDQLLRRMGYERFLDEVGGLVVATDDKGQEIIHTADGSQRNVALVRVICPTTGNRYLLRIPPDIFDVQAAIAWTFRKQPNQWRPEKET